MKTLLLVMFLLLPGAAAAGSHCFNSVVEDPSGAVFSIAAGWLFAVFPGEQPIADGWLPLDRLSICPLGGEAYAVTNLSRHDEVKALRELPD